MSISNHSEPTLTNYDRVADLQVFTTRVSKIRHWMHEHGWEAVLLRKRRSFSWLTGGRSNHIVQSTEEGVADIVVFSDRVVGITTRMEAARIQGEELPRFPIEWVIPEWYEGHESTIQKICNGKKLACDGIWYGIGSDESVELSSLTYRLDPTDTNRYRWLSYKTAQIVEETSKTILPGMKEWQIQAIVATQLIELGIHPQVLLVATDERIFTYRHPIPTDKKLRSYAMIVVCAEKWGLVTNVTRFVHFGPLPETLEQNRKTLALIDVEFIANTRPGISIGEVFKNGVESYEKYGHTDDWKLLHQGGPTGYASREFLATFETTEIVQVNQAFTWNPSIHGLKSEDTILVQEHGNEILTFTRDWAYIPVEKDGFTWLRPDIWIREKG